MANLVDLLESGITASEMRRIKGALDLPIYETTVYMNADQSIPNNAWTAVTWTAKTDEVGLTQTVPQIWVDIPSSGVTSVEIEMDVRWSSASGSSRNIYWTERTPLNVVVGSLGGAFSLPIYESHRPVRINRRPLIAAGNRLYLEVYHFSGGAVTLKGTTLTSAVDWSGGPTIARLRFWE